MTEPGTLWEELPEPERKRAKRELRRLVGKKFEKLYRELGKVLNAMEYEIRWKGVASPDNIRRRDEINRKIIKLINEEDREP